MGLFGKKKSEIEIAINILKNLIERLENIRILKSSVKDTKQIMDELVTESADYDGIIAKVIQLLNRLFMKDYEEKELIIIEKNVFGLLNRAKINDDYVLTEQKYAMKLENLNLAIKELIDLEKGNIKVQKGKLTSIKGEKKSLVNNAKKGTDYSKAA